MNSKKVHKKTKFCVQGLDSSPAYELFYTKSDEKKYKELSKWKIDPICFYKTLLKILKNPNSIYQSPFGFCGQVSFLRVWSLRDPDSLVNFAINLLTKGEAYLGTDYKVEGKNLLNCSWKLENPDEPITEAAWVICSALAITEDDILPEFEGKPKDSLVQNLSASTTSYELCGWLEKLKDSLNETIYEKVENNVPLLSSIGCDPLQLFQPDVDDAMQLKPDKKTDIFLCLNTNMYADALSYKIIDIDNSTKKEYNPPNKDVLKFYPTHWVTLEESIKREHIDGGDNDKLTIVFWQYGEIYEMIVTVKDFNEDFYGSIIATAKKDKRIISNPITESKFYSITLYTKAKFDGDPTEDKNGCLYLEFKISSSALNLKIDWFRVRLNGTPIKEFTYLYKNQTNGNYVIRIPLSEVDTADLSNMENLLFEIDALTAYNFETIYKINFKNPIFYEVKYGKFLYKFCGPGNKNALPGFNNPDLGYAYPKIALNALSVQLPNGQPIGTCSSEGKIEVYFSDPFIYQNKTLGDIPYIPYYLQKFGVYFEYFATILNEYFSNNFSNEIIIGVVPEKSEEIDIIINNNINDIDMSTYILDKLCLSYQGEKNSCLKSTFNLIKDFIFKENKTSKDIDFYIKNINSKIPVNCDEFYVGQFSAFFKFLNLRNPNKNILNILSECSRYCRYHKPNNYNLPNYYDILEFTYSNPIFAKEYDNFVLAILGNKFSNILADNNLLLSSSSPIIDTYNLISTNKINLNKENINFRDITYSLINLDSSVEFVRINKNHESSLQILLLDSDEKIINIIKTDQKTYLRGIGLYNKRVKKIMICEYLKRETGELIITPQSKGLDLSINDVYFTQGDDPNAVKYISAPMPNDVTVKLHFEIINTGNCSSDNLRITFLTSFIDNISASSWIPLNLENSPDKNNCLIDKIQKDNTLNLVAEFKISSNLGDKLKYINILIEDINYQNSDNNFIYGILIRGSELESSIFENIFDRLWRENKKILDLEIIVINNIKVKPSIGAIKIVKQ